MSERPEHGIRYELVRVEGDAQEGVTLYRGHAHTKEGSVPLEARIEHASGSASARVGDSDRRPSQDEEGVSLRELEKGAAALVRATARSYLAEGRRPPRRILRWRERPPQTHA